MGFQPAGDFLVLAAEKYNLGRQAQASLVCRRVKTLFAERYPEFADTWVPVRYEDKKLIIQVASSAASSALFLRTHELQELFETEDVLQQVEEVRIVRGQ